MALRMNRRSINPSKPTPVKRDPSYLDWHYKLPTEEELSDPYPCFPPGFWASFYQAAKEATTLPPKKRSDPETLKTQIKRDACEDCELWYQKAMIRLDRCHPVEGAVTPLMREGSGEDESN